MKRCNFFDEALGFCDKVVFHDSVKDNAMIWLVVFVIGISYLALKAFETPPDVPPPLERWPFGD